MDAGFVLQIIMIAIGVLIVCITLLSLANSRMTEPFALIWGLFALVFIIAGFLLRPSGWDQYISPAGLILIVILMMCAIHVIYFITCRVSELMRKINELAIQVSLLHAEKETMQKEIEELHKKLEDRTEN